MKNYFSIQKILLLTFALVVSAEITYGQGKNENLQIVWPEEYKWKEASTQEDSNMLLLEIIPGNESIDNWTMAGTMCVLKGEKNLPLDTAMRRTVRQIDQKDIKAKITILERNDTCKNPWIIFSIESPLALNNKNPESDLFYLIQGDHNFYMNEIAIKESTLSAEFINKWSRIFKESTFTESIDTPQGKIESLVTVWAEEYNWKVRFKDTLDKVIVLGLLPEKESIDNWTIMGTMMLMKGQKNIDLITTMNFFVDKAVEADPKAKLTFHEKNDMSKHKSVIFITESPSISQLFYVIQGEQDLHVNIIGVKKSTLSTEFIAKWSKVFKESKFVYHDVKE